MWRVPGERIQLDLDGPSVEVEPLRSWMIQTEALVLAQRAQAADEGLPKYAALKPFFEYFVAEAQPSWDIVDHLGAVPNTVRGMARLPLGLAVEITNQWLESLDKQAERPEIPGLSLVESDAPSAVDAVIPQGALNREVKKRLRAVKAA